MEDSTTTPKPPAPGYELRECLLEIGHAAPADSVRSPFTVGKDYWVKSVPTSGGHACCVWETDSGLMQAKDGVGVFWSDLRFGPPKRLTAEPTAKCDCNWFWQDADAGTWLHEPGCSKAPTVRAFGPAEKAGPPPVFGGPQCAWQPEPTEGTAPDGREDTPACPPRPGYFLVVCKRADASDGRLTAGKAYWRSPVREGDTNNCLLHENDAGPDNYIEWMADRFTEAVAGEAAAGVVTQAAEEGAGRTCSLPCAHCCSAAAEAFFVTPATAAAAAGESRFAPGDRVLVAHKGVLKNSSHCNGAATVIKRGLSPGSYVVGVDGGCSELVVSEDNLTPLRRCPGCDKECDASVCWLLGGGMYCTRDCAERHVTAAVAVGIVAVGAARPVPSPPPETFTPHVCVSAKGWEGQLTEGEIYAVRRLPGRPTCEVWKTDGGLRLSVTGDAPPLTALPAYTRFLPVDLTGRRKAAPLFLAPPPGFTPHVCLCATGWAKKLTKGNTYLVRHKPGVCEVWETDDGDCLVPLSGLPFSKLFWPLDRAGLSETAGLSVDRAVPSGYFTPHVCVCDVGWSGRLTEGNTYLVRGADDGMCEVWETDDGNRLLRVRGPGLVDTSRFLPGHLHDAEAAARRWAKVHMPACKLGLVTQAARDRFRLVKADPLPHDNRLLPQDDCLLTLEWAGWPEVGDDGMVGVLSSSQWLALVSEARAEGPGHVRVYPVGGGEYLIDVTKSYVRALPHGAGFEQADTPGGPWEKCPKVTNLPAVPRCHGCGTAAGPFHAAGTAANRDRRFYCETCHARVGP